MTPRHIRQNWIARIASLFAAVLAIAGSFHLFGEFSPTALGIVGVMAIVSLGVGIRRLPAGARHPWGLIVVGLVLLNVSAALRESLETMGNLTATRSLVPDAFSVPGYVLLVVGLGCALRIRRRDVGGGVDAFLDSMLAGLAAMALAWVFLLEPALAQTTATIGVRLSLVAYPPMSIMFVVLTAQLAFSRGTKRIAAIVATVAAMVSLLVGDVVFILSDARVIDVDVAWTTLPFMLSYVAIVYFSLHSTFVEYANQLPEDNTPASPARLALVALSLTIPAMVAVTQHETATADRIVLASIVLMLTATATWRMVRALLHHARSEKTLLYQATHDLLTGALNRAGLLNEMKEMSVRGTPYAVLFLDMDRFKLVNDTFGHSFGDQLLVAVAQRLDEYRRLGDVVGRIGGDEFVVVTDASLGVDSVVKSADRLRKSFSQPFVIGDTEVPVSFSVGIATSGPGDEPEMLLRDADTAMYGAKDVGRDSVLVFDQPMRDKVSTRLELERDLRHALARDELEVHFQPVVDITNGQPVGFEALMRWNHPTRGTVPPLDFIPIAEETGIIIEIGAWILDEACHELALWRATLPGGADLWCSVNVSARQLRDADFLFMVERALARYEMPPEALVLEVTESILIDESITMPAVLDRIRAAGLRLSIDDFGTGYSSLAYVQRYPFNCVKIDRAFVELLDAEEGSEHQLVGAIVAMANALDLTTIAEGVETAEQTRRLLELGCTTVQGYYFSRPVPAAQIPTTLERLRSARATQPV